MRLRRAEAWLDRSHPASAASGQGPTPNRRRAGPSFRAPIPREHKEARHIRLAPRHTGSRSSSSSPAARHSRGQVGQAPPRPRARAGQGRRRHRRGRSRERARASEPPRRVRGGSLVGSWNGSWERPGFCRVTTYRSGWVCCLDGRQEFPLFTQPQRGRDLMLSAVFGRCGRRSRALASAGVI
jgi:hypothetical protein